MLVDIIYHPTENIEKALKILLESDIFSVVKAAPLPNSDGETWKMRLDLKKSVNWQEFHEAIDRFLEFCDKNGIQCKIIISPSQ